MQSNKKTKKNSLQLSFHRTTSRFSFIRCAVKMIQILLYWMIPSYAAHWFAFDISLHPLHQLKCLPVDDRLMCIFYQIGVKLSLILFPFASQKIRGIGFLHQNLPDVFLITQHSVDGGGTPFRFARYCFDPMRLQISFDFTYPVTLDIETKDFAYDLSFLRHDLQNAVRPFGIAKEPCVVQYSFSASHAVADTELDVLASEVAFGLCEGRKLVDHTVTDVQGIQSSILDVNPDIHFLQPPDLTDSFQCVPAKTAQRLHQDQVYVPFGTVSQELLITGALIRTGARCGVGIHFGQYPIGMAMDVACIVLDLGCQTVLLFLIPNRTQPETAVFLLESAVLLLEF